MIRVEMKNYNTMLIETQPKHQLYHQTKLVNMNILQENKYYHQNQKQIIEQTKFTCSPLGKAFEKQIKAVEDQGKKQLEALKVLKPKEQTKTIEGKSDNKLSMQKETYNRLLNDILNEIQEISKKN